MDSLALYIHIPFCERKCYYCDFTSFAKEGKDIDNYIDNLIKELSLYKDKLSNHKIETIFIGGGTPSSIHQNYIKRILDYIYENYNIENLVEVSIEINPGTLTLLKAKEYKSFGINRVSMGAQSLNGNLLKAIGRIHTVKDIKDSIEILRKANFNNINVDLMFGLPGQEINDIEEALQFVSDYNIEHVSFYSLIVEEETLIHKWHNKGLLQLPDEELDREMYSKVVNYLKLNGYKHYEISNFARKGLECKHNLAYWNVKPYLGVGASSHSNLFNKRFWNYSNLKHYSNALNNSRLPLMGEEEIDIEMEIGEYCILGLRLIDGIDKKRFKNRFGLDINTKFNEVIFKHINNGLLIDANEHIRLTDKGLDLANLVEVDFMP